MAKGKTTRFGAKFRAVDLGTYFNWPPRSLKDNWWNSLAKRIRGYPEGNEPAWGIPFRMGTGVHRRVILVAQGRPDVTIRLSGKANFICLLHAWHQLPDEIKREDPSEGLVVAEYVLTYSDGATQAQPVRGRFEVAMVESPGPPWLAQAYGRAPGPILCPSPPGLESWEARARGTPGCW